MATFTFLFLNIFSAYSAIAASDRYLPITPVQIGCHSAISGKTEHPYAGTYLDNNAYSKLIKGANQAGYKDYLVDSIQLLHDQKATSQVLGIKNLPQTFSFEDFYIELARVKNKNVESNNDINLKNIIMISERLGPLRGGEFLKEVLHVAWFGTKAAMASIESYDGLMINGSNVNGVAQDLVIVALEWVLNQDSRARGNNKVVLTQLLYETFDRRNSKKEINGLFDSQYVVKVSRPNEDFDELMLDDPIAQAFKNAIKQIVLEFPKYLQ